MLRLKQGASLKIVMMLTDEMNENLPVDVTGWTITSSVKRSIYDKKPLGFFHVEAVNPLLGEIHLTANSNLWPVGRLMFDVKYVMPNGSTIYSDPVDFYLEATIA